MTPADAARIHWQAQWETYADAAKEKAREYRDARRDGFGNVEWFAMTDRLFRKYLRLARDAKAKLDEIETKKAA